MSLEIVVATLALILAGFAIFKIKQLSARLNKTTESYARTTRKLEFLEHTLEKNIAGLGYELKKHTGTLRFHPDMTFKEALALDPSVQNVMNEMHVGGCPDCAVDTNQTLAYGATINSVNVDEFLSMLNSLPVQQTNQDIKLPQKSKHPDLNIL